MSSIVIDRVPLNLLGATTHARAERLARRIRDAVQRSLPAELNTACGRALADDEAYVFIDRLDVHCVVGAHWDDDAIGRVFARQLAGTLLRERYGSEAVVFRDRPEFLAAFIAALVDGCAFSRWWFAEFNGLRRLPVSAALRTLVAGEPGIAWRALARLSPSVLGRAVAVLSPTDAERVLATVAEARDEVARTAALIQALDAATHLAAPGPARLVAALALLETHHGQAPTARNHAALRLLSAIVSAARSARLRAPTTADDVATLRDWCDGLRADAAECAVASALDAGVVIAHALASTPTHATAAGEVSASADAAYTAHGGAVLLAVLLVKLGWWADWQRTLQRTGASGSEGLAARTALAVVSRALSPKRPARVERDECLQRVFGVAAHSIGDRSSRRLVRNALWLGLRRSGIDGGRRMEPLLRASARVLVREFAARLVGGCESTDAYVRTQCLACGAAVSADGRRAALGRAPLDVVLVLSGLKRADVTLPDGRRLVVAQDSPS
jgi:hypothetical protein